MQKNGILIAVAALALMALAATPAAAQENTTDNESLTIGQQVSLIATDNAHEVRDQVQRRAFGITLNRSSNRSQVVQQRVQELHEQVRQRQQEREHLLQQLQNDTITPQQFAHRITVLNREVARTAQGFSNVERNAQRHGVNASPYTGLNQSLRGAIDALRNRAAANVSVLDNAMEAHRLAQRTRSGNFTGPEIAEFAKQLGFNKSRVGPPEGVPGGPPEGTPGGPGAQPGNDTEGNGQAGGPPNQSNGAQGNGQP